jgi:flagellum-specific peptidoglycan hydrolase FlgJ
MAFNTPKDGQPVNYFRVYKTVEDSIVDHTIFLKSNKRYTAAGVFAAKTPQTQAQCLQNAGYAEGAGYASKLNQIIKDYNLEILDTLEISSKKKIF